MIDRGYVAKSEGTGRACMHGSRSRTATEIEIHFLNLLYMISRISLVLLFVALCNLLVGAMHPRLPPLPPSPTLEDLAGFSSGVSKTHPDRTGN